MIEQLAPHDRGGRIGADQLEIIVPEHREVVHRSERVPPERRQIEAQSAIARSRVREPLARVHHDMVENRRGERVTG